jgi:hypothetical protein
MNDLEAFEQFWVSSGTTNREDKLEAWEAALKYGRKKQTHIESFLEMLISIGYSGEVLQERDKFGVSISSNGDKVHGYMGFVAHFEFNPDGSLNNVGIYE